MRLAFFGDGIRATKCLKKVIEHEHDVVAIVLRNKPPDDTTEILAQQTGIPIYRPRSVNSPDFVAELQANKPDLCVSVYYDQIFRTPIIESSKMGIINCHAGKLPYYRGLNVINWAIINDEKEIGLTVHYIDEGIDTGDIILQRTLPVRWTDTYGSIIEKVQSSFPGLLVEALELIKKGEVRRQAQSYLQGTYFSARIPGDEFIDWRDTSLSIYNKIRAITDPGPGARTLLGKQVMLIWAARYDPDWPKYIATPGEVVGKDLTKGVIVKTGDSTIIIESIQFEGHEREIPMFPIGTRFKERL